MSKVYVGADEYTPSLRFMIKQLARGKGVSARVMLKFLIQSAFYCQFNVKDKISINEKAPTAPTVEANEPTKQAK